MSTILATHVGSLPRTQKVADFIFAREEGRAYDPAAFAVLMGARARYVLFETPNHCGFGTFAGFGAVDPEIAYAKLAALGEGARIAESTK